MQNQLTRAVAYAAIFQDWLNFNDRLPFSEAQKQLARDRNWFISQGEKLVTGEVPATMDFSRALKHLIETENPN